MPLFSRRIPYDRKRLLSEADGLRDGRRWRRALKLYRQILAAEPRNAEIHFRVAPLLARSGRHAEAWESFRVAAEGISGDDSSRIALHQRAVKSLPRSFEACRALASIWLRSQHPDRAERTLLEGSRRLRRRATRGQAIVLLRDAREIDPWNPSVVLDLCRLLAKDGRAAEALFLLDHLDERVSADDRRAVRALSWRIEPSLRHTWRWLRAGGERRGARGSTTPRRQARRAA
jgi:thioredoxin-like negative regulator of GroEL